MGTLLGFTIHITHDASMTHLFQRRWEHHRNEDFAIIQLEKGEERIEIMAFGCVAIPNAKAVYTSFILQSAQSKTC